MPTRRQVFEVLAGEITAYAQRMTRKDPNVVRELEQYTSETLMDRVVGEWAAFENIVFDVQSVLDRSKAGFAIDDETFTKQVVKYASKLRDKAAGKQMFAKPGK
jgi:hypothetical protein